MQMKHRQAIHGLVCLAVLRANPENPDRDHYKIMEMFTRKVLDKNSELAQLELELRIAGLEATAEFLRQRVADRETLAAAETNPGDDNTIPRLEAHEPEKCFVSHQPRRMKKIFAGVQLDNNNEVAQVDGAPPTERLEAKAASLAGRLAVEGSLTAISANPEDLYIKQDELMGIAPSRRLDKKSEVTPFDLELQTSGLNNSVNFSRSNVRLHMYHRRRGKTNWPTGSQASYVNSY